MDDGQAWIVFAVMAGADPKKVAGWRLSATEPAECTKRVVVKNNGAQGAQRPAFCRSQVPWERREDAVACVLLGGVGQVIENGAHGLEISLGDGLLGLW
jgi:hypothetical protein